MDFVDGQWRYLVSLFSGFTLGGSWLRRSFSPRGRREGAARSDRRAYPTYACGRRLPRFDHRRCVGRFVQTRVDCVQPFGVGSCQRHDRVEKGKVTLKGASFGGRNSLFNRASAAENEFFPATEALRKKAHLLQFAQNGIRGPGASLEDHLAGDREPRNVIVGKLRDPNGGQDEQRYEIPEGA